MATMSRTSLRQSLRMLLPLLSLLGVLALVIMACGGSSANAGTKIGSGAAPTNTAKVSKHFKVGDQVNVGDTYVVTINSVKTSHGGEFDSRKSGDIFLVVDLSIKNVGTEEEIISTLDFTLKDATGQRYDDTYMEGATDPGGKLEAGDLVKGQIVYEIPSNQHQFSFAFAPDLFSGGQTVWDLRV